MLIVSKHFFILFPNQLIAALHQSEKKKFYSFYINVMPRGRSIALNFMNTRFQLFCFFSLHEILYFIFIDHYIECVSLASDCRKSQKLKLEKVKIGKIFCGSERGFSKGKTSRRWKLYERMLFSVWKLQP